MHPILFRIPLPHTPLKLWWVLAAVAAIAAVYALIGLRRKDRATAISAFLVIVASAAAGFAFREMKLEAPNLPIYSYGVMLGLSLVVGWYLTLKLAEKDGLPKETMANCYVVTALAAILGARVLYIVTNLDEFRVNAHDPNSDVLVSSFFALRRGGLVAYGGFLGGLIGSWLYLARHRIRLMPWADVAVPSLASGLFITRIGCYLFGCDFGKRLPDTAPEVLQRLGTFPHWGTGMLDGGDGSPAFIKHLEAAGHGTPAAADLVKMNHSFPVHPTQIYESVVGLALLLLLLWQRKNQKFRGQIFFLFAFAYGYVRFIIEMLRDDSERGEFGTFDEHLFVPGALLLMAIAFAFGISLGIRNKQARTLARVLAFVPPVVAYLALHPASFSGVVQMHPSTSQWIGFLSAMVVSFFYAKFWETARKSPKLAMGLESLGDVKPAPEDGMPRKRRDDDEDEDDEEDDGEEVPPRVTKTSKKKAAAGAETEDEPRDGNADGDEPDDDDASSPPGTQGDDEKKAG
ncbi:MAG: prolipoprotein diacylglyceryl transferase [Polyangiaceae bacterium]|nr:prolipoprotein diacylglyceryl transferase [Polyangiaceae bacterium]